MAWQDEVRAARAAGSLEQALSILEKELSARPLDPQVHYHFAWTHDSLGKEADAVPYYKRAIELGLSDEDLMSAYLGLGSTYRSLGHYDDSLRTFDRGVSLFPECRAMRVFRSLTLANLNRNAEAIETLLCELAETSSDESIQRYKKALLFYSDKLNQVFE